MTGEAEKIHLGDFPNLMEIIKKTLNMGIEIFACEASKQMLGRQEIELIEGVKIVGAGTLNDLALEADANGAKAHLLGVKLMASIAIAAVAALGRIVREPHAIT